MREGETNRRKQNMSKDTGYEVMQRGIKKKTEKKSAKAEMKRTHKKRAKRE